MKSKYLFIAGLFVASLLFTSCGEVEISEQVLIGTWELKTVEPLTSEPCRMGYSLDTVTEQLTFYADHHFHWFVVGESGKVIYDTDLQIYHCILWETDEYTWHLSDDNLLVIPMYGVEKWSFPNSRTMHWNAYTYSVTSYDYLRSLASMTWKKVK